MRHRQERKYYMATELLSQNRKFPGSGLLLCLYSNRILLILNCMQSSPALTLKVFLSMADFRTKLRAL